MGSGGGVLEVGKALGKGWELRGCVNGLGEVKGWDDVAAEVAMEERERGGAAKALGERGERGEVAQAWGERVRIRERKRGDLKCGLKYSILH